MGTSSLIPLDIYSVKQVGPERWFRDFYWPITEVESRDLWNFLHEAYRCAVAGLEDRREADVMLGAYKLTVDTWMILQSAVNLARIRRTGREPLYQPDTPYLGLLDDSGRGAPRLDPFRRFRKVSLARRLGAVVRTRADDLFHGRWPTLDESRRLAESSVATWGYADQSELLYSQQVGARPVLLHPALWKPRSTMENGIQAARYHSVVEDFVDRAQRIAEEHRVALSARVLKLLREQARRWVLAAAIASEGLTSKMTPPRAGSTSVLMTGLGGMLTKSFAIAARRKGYRVVGFPHGHNYGQDVEAANVYNEMGIVDEYVAPTEASANLFSRLVRTFPFPGSTDVDVGVVQRPTEREIWAAHRQSPRPPRIDSVMFVAPPLTYQRYPGVYAYWPYQVELLMRVARRARKVGCRTILKRHPDRLSESEGVYDAFFDRLITAPFESVFHQADAFFFPNLLSTTFPFALTTNRPVIIPDRLLDGVWPDLREALGARCRSVPSWFASDGRLELDEMALEEAFSRAPKEPDYRFVREYMT